MKCIPIAACLTILSVSPVLKAGDIATERTQAATLAVIGFIQNATAQIEGIVGKIEMLEATAGKYLNDLPGAIAQLPGVADVFDLFEQIEGVIEAGTDLAYSAGGLEDFMKERFNTYDSYLQAIVDDGGIVRETFENRFKEWNKGHRDTIRTIMKAHGIHANQLATEKTRLETLENLSLTSEGRMQAMQVGHQVAIEGVKQMHKLRELLMEQSNLHASYFATKQAMEAESEAATTYITERRQVVPVDDGTGF